MGFSSLHPLLRHHLVNTLGWRRLRPLQEQAISPVLQGSHALLIAPTAGGKTEAAVFPVISRLLEGSWEGTSILYVCPLKALLNNLHERLSAYFEMVGYSCALWHGDVNASERRRVVRSMPACILTTPESIEAMLISSKAELEGFLANIRVVIVDEIHAFAGQDRGTHLLCLLERLTRAAPHPVQRIGLSATVGNPGSMLEWLVCGRSDPKQLVSIAPFSRSAEVRIDYVGSLENAAYVISRLFKGEKRLVFCDSRRRVEELTHLLNEAGVTAYASHSSLSRDNRQISEDAFSQGRDCVIVATSTLELGIDVGDLDRVIQIDAPGSVASFLQRIGRTGRRPDSVRNCLYLTTSPEALLKACAIVELWQKGFVEPIEAPKTPHHLVGQQLMTLCLERGRISERSCIDAIALVPGIRDLDAEKRRQLIEHMVSNSFLVRDGGFLAIGPEAESRFGRRHFSELLSVFSDAPSFEVFEGKRAIGYLDWMSLVSQPGKQRSPIILAGRSWAIQAIEWSKRRVYVVPSAEKGRIRWQGHAQGLSFPIAREVLQLLCSSDSNECWTGRATNEMSNQRAELGELAKLEGQAYSDNASGGVTIPTFWGSIINGIVLRYLSDTTGVSGSSDDLCIRLTNTMDSQRIRYQLKHLTILEIQKALVPDRQWIDGLKFSSCLPPSLSMEVLLGSVPYLESALGSIGKPPQASNNLWGSASIRREEQ